MNKYFVRPDGQNRMTPNVYIIPKLPKQGLSLIFLPGRGYVRGLNWVESEMANLGATRASRKHVESVLGKPFFHETLVTMGA